MRLEYATPSIILFRTGPTRSEAVIALVLLALNAGLVVSMWDDSVASICSLSPYCLVILWIVQKLWPETIIRADGRTRELIVEQARFRRVMQSWRIDIAAFDRFDLVESQWRLMVLVVRLKNGMAVETFEVFGAPDERFIAKVNRAVADYLETLPANETV